MVFDQIRDPEMFASYIYSPYMDDLVALKFLYSDELSSEYELHAAISILRKL